MLKLSMPASLYNISYLFGMAKATTREAILDVYGAFQYMLANTMVWVTEPLCNDGRLLSTLLPPGHWSP